jgi:plasmid stabilization system protein ParE
LAVDLVIDPQAANDLDEAYAWYENQRVGLGEDFLTRVQACLTVLQRFPEMHARVHGDYRRALVRKFPYAIFYEYADNRVTIYSVFHTSQDPEKWKRRLP